MNQTLVLMKNLFWSAGTSNRKHREMLFQAISQKNLLTLMTLKKWFLVFLLILCQIPVKVCYVKVIDLLYHLKRLIRQIFGWSSNFFIEILFNLPFEKRNFLKNKLKDICFATLNSYSFDNVNANLTESQCEFLKKLIHGKDLVN